MAEQPGIVTRDNCYFGKILNSFLPHIKAQVSQRLKGLAIDVCPLGTCPNQRMPADVMRDDV